MNAHLKNHNLAKYIALFFLVLFLLPLLNILSAEEAPLIEQIDFIFHTQRSYLVIALAMLSFYFIAGRKIFSRQSESRANWICLAIGAALFILISSVTIPFFIALQNNLITVDNSGIHYTKLGLFGATFPIGSTELFNSSVLVKNYFIIDDYDSFPEKVMIKWFGSVSGKNQLSGKTSIILAVNDQEYDVSKNFLSAPGGIVSLMGEEVDKSALKPGRNSLAIRAKSTEARAHATIARQYYYYPNSIISYDGGKTFSFEDGVVLLFIDDRIKPTLTEQAIFPYKPAFVLIAFILLFIGFFGLGFSRHIYHAAKIELLLSVFLSFCFFILLTFVETYWKIFATAALALTNFLLSMFFDNITFITENVRCPQIGPPDYINLICKSSSGFESAALFTFLSFVILISSWSLISKQKFLVFYFFGVAGTVLINGLRIFLILLIGITFSKEFASGVFHTNIGWILFLAYSALFWLLALRFIKKK